MTFMPVSGAWAGARSTFNQKFLEQLGDDTEIVDLDQFSSSQAAQLPGIYRVDLYLNEAAIGTREIEFLAAEGVDSSQEDAPLKPCLSVDDLRAMGVRVEAFPAFEQLTEAQKACVPFETIIPLSQATFDFSHQRLDLSFPQASVHQETRGAIAPEHWDEGIPAALVDYSFSGSNSKSRRSGGEDSDYYYLNLRSGFNYGAWRLRNYSTFVDSDGEQEWDNVNTYVQRDIKSLRSQLTLGDTYTPSDVFDSFSFRGMQLASDDQMLPDSMQGFAPVVRGIARSNAMVTIRQNGYVIYQSYVAPGAFAITDLYPTSASGDLEVEVKEADGSIQRYTQPFAALPVLQREGRLKYSVTAGDYRRGDDDNGPGVGQATALYGLPHGTTVYGGAQVAEDYTALALGVGQNLANFGAISFDVTQANSDPTGHDKESGQSYRFLYAKSFADTGTDFRLLGYRYSTKGFYTLSEALDIRASREEDPPYGQIGNDDFQDWDWLSGYRVRSEVQGSLSQTLGNYGSVYANLSKRDYWDGRNDNKLAQMGYNHHIGPVSVGLSYSYSKSDYQEDDDQAFSMNVSLPLNAVFSAAPSSSWLSGGLDTRKNGPTSYRTGISGSLLSDGRLGYSVQNSQTDEGIGHSAYANVNYQGIYANTNASYSDSDDQRQLSYGMSGGILAHSDGVTFSQPLSDTVLLVKAPGADGAKILNQTGVRTDWRGYAVMPYLREYRENRVALDASTLGDNVELTNPVQRVVPTHGAVVRAEFSTRVGYRVLMSLSRLDGQPVPFGATVSFVDANGEPLDAVGETDDTGTFIVGDQGQAYLSGLEPEGHLKVQWGQDAAQQCLVDYALNVPEVPPAVLTAEGKCHALSR